MTHGSQAARRPPCEAGCAMLLRARRWRRSTASCPRLLLAQPEPFGELDVAKEWARRDFARALDQARGEGGPA